MLYSFERAFFDKTSKFAPLCSTTVNQVFSYLKNIKKIGKYTIQGKQHSFTMVDALKMHLNHKNNIRIYHYVIISIFIDRR
jgi:hypothetical protein